VMVERLLRNRTFAGIAQHALVGTLKQVARFLSDQPTKERVMERVQDAVHDDTRVLIGHSMGSIVAYEYLCRYRPPGIRLLVTLGSPLGIRNLIFDRLTPAPVNGVGVWPGKTGTWVNVADPNDVVALRKELSPLWLGPFSGNEITDRRVDNGNEPHSAARYLNSRQAGAALGEALRDGLG
jgi:pimeloyl-ACP methyl ester carboxylesterase